MFGMRLALRVLTLGVVLGASGWTAHLSGQASDPTSTQGQTSQPAQARRAPVAPAKPSARRKSKVRQTIPVETAPPSAPASRLTEAQQKAADQRLLEQQQRESIKAAQTNDELVRRAQRREDQQSVPRIEDGPQATPSGTPTPSVIQPNIVVPNDSRIQDVPTYTPVPTRPAQPVTPTQTTSPPQTD